MPLVNEWTFTSEAASIINEIANQRPDLPFRRASVEERTKGKLKRRDLTIYGLRDKILLTGEVKLPDSADDGWHCFACKAGGDSARLFARISAWPEQDDRRTLAEVFRDAGMTPDTVSYDPFASYEDYADVIDAINTNAPPKGNACQ